MVECCRFGSWIDEALFDRWDGMVFVRNEPFAATFLQAYCQAEVERPSRRSVAMDLACDEGDILAYGHAKVGRLVGDGSLRLA